MSHIILPRISLTTAADRGRSPAASPGQIGRTLVVLALILLLVHEVRTLRDHFAAHPPAAVTAQR